MNRLDDNELIDQLRAGLADRTDDVHAPDGLAADARRLARRRATTRAVGAGVPVLAAAGVATALLVGSGGGTQHTTLIPAPSNATAPGVHAQDTAYIVKRVKAKVTGGTSGTVLESFTYYSGDVGADGSIANLGNKQVAAYNYTDPDGTNYTNTQWYYEDGTPRISYFGSFVPNSSGATKGTLTLVNINAASRIYSQTDTQNTDLSTDGVPTLDSPAAVRQALQDGQVTQTGTTTIDGTSAIVLSVKDPQPTGAPSVPVTLLVDAQTYQPLRLVSGVVKGSPLVSVDEWVPATSANIALARQSVPAGYQEVKAPTYGRAGGYSGNSGAGPLQQPDTGSGNSGNSGTSGNS